MLPKTGGSGIRPYGVAIFFDFSRHCEECVAERSEFFDIYDCRWQSYLNVRDAAISQHNVTFYHAF